MNTNVEKTITDTDGNIGNNAITFKDPRVDEDGFFSVWGGAHPDNGGKYSVKTKGLIRSAVCAIEDDICFLDGYGEVIEDVEWVKPMNDNDTLGFVIYATRDEIAGLLEALRGLRK